MARSFFSEPAWAAPGPVGLCVPRRCPLRLHLQPIFLSVSLGGLAERPSARWPPFVLDAPSRQVPPGFLPRVWIQPSPGFLPRVWTPPGEHGLSSALPDRPTGSPLLWPSLPRDPRHRCPPEAHLRQCRHSPLNLIHDSIVEAVRDRRHASAGHHPATISSVSLPSTNAQSSSPVWPAVVPSRATTSTALSNGTFVRRWWSF